MSSRVIKTPVFGFSKYEFVMSIYAVKKNSILILLIFATSIRLDAEIFFVSPNGLDTNNGSESSPWLTLQKAANTLQPGQTVYIAPGTYNGAVRAMNSGSAAGRITYSGIPGLAKPVIDGLNIKSILFDLNDRNYITLYGLRLVNGGVRGIASGPGIAISNLRIENCEVVSMAAAGISLKGCSDAVVKGNVLDNVVNLLRATGECLTLDKCEFVDVVNNEIRNCTLSEGGGEGICIKASSNIRVYGNYVHDNLHTAGKPGRPAIYIDSYLGFQRNIEVFNNRIVRCDIGIILTGELRNATTNVRIYNNIIKDVEKTPLAVAEWGDFYVMNWPNLFLDDVVIENNTIYNSAWPDSWRPGVYIDTPLARRLVVRNNLIYNYNPAISVKGAVADLSLVNNFANNTTPSVQSSLGPTGVTGDPLFLETETFKIAANSAARGRGAQPAVAKYDFNFKMRPSANSCDIGAIQYFTPQDIPVIASVNPVSKPSFTGATFPLALGGNDGFENAQSGSVTLGSNNVFVGWPKLESVPALTLNRYNTAEMLLAAGASNKNTGALRFTGVSIPKRAKILSAWLTLNASTVTHGKKYSRKRIDGVNVYIDKNKGYIKEGQTTTAYDLDGVKNYVEGGELVYGGKNIVDVIGIRGELSGNSPPLLSTPYNLTSRTRTTSFFNAYTQKNGSLKIGSIANVISEVINRPDWVTGGAVTLLLESFTVPCSLAYSTFESGASNAPKLFVEYLPPSDLVDSPPTIGPISSISINEDTASAPLSFTVSDAETTPASLILSAYSNNPVLFPEGSITFGGSGGYRTVKVQPAANQNGTALITVTVNDGQVSNNTSTRTFGVTVTAVNDVPTLSAIMNPTPIRENAGSQTVLLSGISAGALNESQTITVKASSDNIGLIQDPIVRYTTGQGTGSLLYSPVSNASGTAKITVTVNDGINTISGTFTVTVIALNAQAAFSTWITGFNVGGLTGAAADFDHDGLGNAVEYLLGSDPSKPNIGLSSVKAGFNTLILQHSQSNTTSSDLVTTYQWSTDLVEWKENGQTNSKGTEVDIATETITNNVAPANDLIKVTYTIRGGPSGKLFARVMVTIPSLP